jgi:hypothetical protein
MARPADGLAADLSERLLLFCIASGHGLAEGRSSPATQ